MFGNIICPGLSTSVSLTPPWLHSQLKNIYGSSLIGLWIGEDIVVDGSNNVTSWSGRVGGTLTQRSTGIFQGTVINNRKGIFNSQAITTSGYTTPINTTNTSTAIAVGTITTLPFDNYRAMVSAGDGQCLIGYSGLSRWFDDSKPKYKNGISDLTTNSALTVYESLYSTTDRAYFDVGCDRVAGAARNHLGAINCVSLLSAVPTQLQRLQTQFVLDSYYRPSQAPAAKLALDLYRLLGNMIVGLWVGEDMIVDGSNNVTSWPGRVGGTLTNYNATLFTTTAMGGRKALSPGADLTSVKCMINANGTWKSVIAVSVGHAAINSYEVLVGPETSFVNSVLDRDGVSNNWRTGFTHYTDGVASEVIPSSGTHVFEASNAETGVTGVRVLGWQTSNRQWTEPMGFVMSLSTVPSADQRALATQVIRGYYSI